VSSIWASANKNAVLMGAGHPKWDSALTPDETDLSGAPSAANEGTLCEEALLCRLHIACRETPGVRTAYVSVGTLDGTATYSVVLGASSYTYDASSGGGTEAEVLSGLASALDAGPGITAEVVASDHAIPTGRTLTAAAVKVTWPSGRIDMSATGTGELTALADAEGAEVQLYALMQARTGSTAPAPWVRFGAPLIVGPEGLVPEQPLRVGGVLRLRARVRHLGCAGDADTVTPAALVSIGPALLEP